MLLHLNADKSHIADNPLNMGTNPGVDDWLDGKADLQDGQARRRKRKIETNDYRVQSKIQ
jgi:hypothetical protein